MKNPPIWQLLKYWISKITITGVIYGFTGQQEDKGWMVIVAGTVMYTTLSLIPLYLILLLHKFLRRNLNWILWGIIIIVLFIFINEGSELVVFPENSRPENAGAALTIFRICDIVSVVICSLLFFVIPYRKKGILHSPESPAT